jgi:uroporphyrinogen-III decarboxylase
MLQLDSTTDIFAAKELLRGHAMFHGDVPAALQALGTPQEMEAYCRKLIDEVGYEGGFILGTGCDSAPDCTFDNLKALVETGKTHQLSRT